MDRLKKKTLIMILIEAIFLIGLGVYLVSMQDYLSLQQQSRDTEQKISQIRELVVTTGTSTQRLKETMDGIYQSKALSLAYMVREKVDPELDDGVMETYRQLLDVDNVFLLDIHGKILFQAQPSAVDFTRARYNQLRTVFVQGTPSQAFEVDMGRSQLRYYGAMVDRTRMAVVAQDPAELDRLTEETSSWKSVLENVSVGLEGYSFVISAKDYTFLYHPDEAMIGQDALDAGIRVEDLDDGTSRWMTVNGEELYCGVVKSGDVYILCAVTRSEINSANAITVIIVLFVFFTAITVVLFYAVEMLRSDRAKAAAEGEDDRVDFGRFRWHKRVGRKLISVSAVGLICILGISYYMQTLFSMSRASFANTQRLEEIETTMGRYQHNVDLLTEQYNTSYVSKGKTAAYIVEKRPDIFQSREQIGVLSQVLGAEYIYVIDSTGKNIATNSPYTNFSLSEDPEEQSYEFRQLLQGRPYLVQPAQQDDMGVYRQYVGVSTRDENGNADGLVQISVLPDLLASAAEHLSLSSMLQNIQVGVNGFAFAVDRDTKNFIYYPDERYIGRSAVDHGMDEDMFQDGDSGYLTLGLDKYYGAAMETDDAFVYVAIPAGELFGDRLLISLSTAGVSLLCLAVMCVLLSVERRPSPEDEDKSKSGDRPAEAVTAAPSAKPGSKKRARMVEVVMPDGTVKRTESAFSRWSTQALGWSEMTPEQKTTMVLKVLLGLLALFIVVAVTHKEAAFTRTSVFRYVIDGTWKKGLNIFATTASIMLLCVISVASMVLRSLLKFLSRSLSARGETVVRLVNNLVKYISVVATLYFCLAMFGVDTKTLLASAGILSLVIGLGAQDLVKDIVAGLFIIFEGEFRVGDIVTIGDWRGTVVEIGVRTTKIEAPGKNIKIINNSAISNVINMTRKESFALCEIGIEYGESLERVEAILEQELPNVRKHLPKITDGPFYSGVASLGESGVILRILAQCAEGDRMGVTRSLNREMKLIFDKYKINVPFPQVVINQPVEFKEATEWQKRQAEKFAEEQQELSKNLEGQPL